MNNTTQQQEFLVGILKRAIAETDKMWNEQVSHAQIVGYL